LLLLLIDPDLPDRAAHPLQLPLWVRVRYDGVDATNGEHLDQLLIARIKLLCLLLGSRWPGGGGVDPLLPPPGAAARSPCRARAAAAGACHSCQRLDPLVHPLYMLVRG
jgi:hypothetical protein